LFSSTKEYRLVNTSKEKISKAERDGKRLEDRDMRRCEDLRER